MELQLLSTEKNLLLTPFVFKYGERAVCYFDTSLLQDFLIRRYVVNILKIEAGGVYWQKGERRAVGLFIFLFVILGVVFLYWLISLDVKSCRKLTRVLITFTVCKVRGTNIFWKREVAPSHFKK